MSRARNYCFTINNPTEEELPTNWTDEWIETNQIRYIVGQMERGESGTIHLQGYVQFKSPVGMKTAKSKVGKRAHMEMSRGSPDEARGYCMKEDTRLSGPWEKGECMKQGQRTDLAKVKVMIENGGLEKVFDEAPEVLLKYPRGLMMMQEIVMKRRSMRKRLELHVTVIWGESGSGKTRSVYDREGFENTYALSYTDGRVWFDGYNGQSVLLIDEFYGAIKYSYLLQLLDIYPLRLEIKGGTVWSNWTKVYFTSNSHPKDWYKGVQDTSALLRRIHEIIKVDKIVPSESVEDSLNLHEVAG